MCLMAHFYGEDEESYEEESDGEGQPSYNELIDLLKKTVSREYEAAGGRVRELEKELNDLGTLH